MPTNEPTTFVARSGTAAARRTPCVAWVTPPCWTVSLTQAYDVCERIGYRNGQADTLKALGGLAQARKQEDHARDHYLAAQDLYRQTGNLAGEKAIERALRRLADPAARRDPRG
jgi:hypothetical protein